MNTKLNSLILKEYVTFGILYCWFLSLPFPVQHCCIVGLKYSSLPVTLHLCPKILYRLMVIAGFHVIKLFDASNQVLFLLFSEQPSLKCMFRPAVVPVGSREFLASNALLHSASNKSFHLTAGPLRLATSSAMRATKTHLHLSFTIDWLGFQNLFRDFLLHLKRICFVIFYYNYTYVKTKGRSADC